MQDLIRNAMEHAAEEILLGRDAGVHMGDTSIRITSHLPCRTRCFFRYVELTRVVDHVGDHVLCRVVTSGSSVPPPRVECGTDWNAAVSMVKDRARAMRVPIM